MAILTIICNFATHFFALTIIKQYFKHINTMKFNDSMEYTSPELEIIQTVVEQGFEASWGDEGYAGDDYDVNDNGGF